jgi:hypothetical protein
VARVSNTYSQIGAQGPVVNPPPLPPSYDLTIYGIEEEPINGYWRCRRMIVFDNQHGGHGRIGTCKYHRERDQAIRCNNLIGDWYCSNLDWRVNFIRPTVGFSPRSRGNVSLRCSRFVSRNQFN